jgi:adenine phosphoribosyltransferase
MTSSQPGAPAGHDHVVGDLADPECTGADREIGPGAEPEVRGGGATPTVDWSAGGRVARLIAEHVLDVPDFPQPGILFKDLTPLFASGPAFAETIEEIIKHHGRESFDVVAGIEARGFMIAAAVAYAARVGVVPIRKAGKLPRQAHAATYALEYGEATLEVHADAFIGGQRVLVLDDVLATGGTAEATLGLVERAGGAIAGFSVLLELSFLGGRQRLGTRPVHALLTV